MYGIINEAGKSVKFTHASDLTKLGGLRLNYKLREEGFPMTDEGIKSYLDSWVDWSNETEEPVETREQIIDQAASTLTYSNIHFINWDIREQISSEERTEVYNAIVKRLERGI